MGSIRSLKTEGAKDRKEQDAKLAQEQLNNEFREYLNQADLYAHVKDDDLSNYLNRHPNVDIQNENGDTALMFACHNGYTEIVKILLDRNANVDIQQCNGWTALMFASFYEHTEIVKLLLDKGANTDAQNYDGDTALMLACENEDTEIVELLKKYGAK